MIDGKTPAEAGAERIADAWSRYWATGALHSCVGSFGTRYGGAIAAWWSEVFQGLAVDDAVLDIGTGAGPLPRMLVERFPSGAMPRIAAVDVAAPAFDAWLDPASSAARHITLHAGVRAEALPFRDGEFDWVCSQFGIEYADQREAVPEALRVLSPRGEAAFVLHAADSVLVEVARHEAAALSAILDDDGLWTSLPGVIEAMVVATTAEGRARLAGDGRADAQRESFNAAVRRLKGLAAASPVPDAFLDGLETLFGLFDLARREGVAVALEAMQRWQLALQDGGLRQQGLLRAALTRDAVEAWAQPFRDAGRPVQVATLAHDDGRLLAWGVRVELPTSARSE